MDSRVIKRGRVAVVTGAGRGLGRAVALRLAGEGADLALLARSQAELDDVAQQARAAGVRAAAVVVDVTSPDAVTRARDEVERLFGRVDIVVNNAGSLLYKPFVPLPGFEKSFPGFDTPISDEEWAALSEVHLGGAVRMLRAFGGALIAQGYGRVINVVSNVVRRGVPFTTAYDTAKGGLVQLTRSLAREWARYGVTVNAVAAGHFLTAMTQAQFDDAKSYQRMVGRIPAGRPGEPEEFAALVAYLCGEESGFVTGEVIAIDGGETL
ncbi:MAG: SDR family oxidoreductase [Mycobacteriaceae bacterium]|nr:SDR family oxidoreductase [Mycobacteriaceae bacterium]